MENLRLVWTERAKLYTVGRAVKLPFFKKNIYGKIKTGAAKDSCIIIDVSY